jgi:hypothetical protein
LNICIYCINTQQQKRAHGREHFYENPLTKKATAKEERCKTTVASKFNLTGALFNEILQ